MQTTKSTLMSGLLSAVLLAAVIGVECSSDTPPNPSSASTTAVPGPPSAKVRALPDIRFPTCTPDGKCTFEGTIVNDGPDCAVSVHGVTHLLDAQGKEIEAQSWSFDFRARPGRQEVFSGCCFSSSAVQSQKGSRTDVEFRSLECI